MKPLTKAFRLIIDSKAYFLKYFFINSIDRVCKYGNIVKGFHEMRGEVGVKNGRMLSPKGASSSGMERRQQVGLYYITVRSAARSCL